MKTEEQLLAEVDAEIMAAAESEFKAKAKAIIVVIAQKQKQIVTITREIDEKKVELKALKFEP